MSKCVPGKSHALKAEMFLDTAKGGWGQVYFCPCGISHTASKQTRDAPELHVYRLNGKEYETLKAADAALRETT